MPRIPPVPRLKDSLAAPLKNYKQPKAQNVFVPPTTTTTTTPIVTATAVAAAAVKNLMDHSTMDHSGMDHGGMDHGGMDHGGMDHGGMDMGNHCSMNMIFNWDTKGPCIVFSQFYVSGPLTLIFYMLLLCLLSIFYEYLRLTAAAYDRKIRARLVLGAGKGGGGGGSRGGSPGLGVGGSGRSSREGSPEVRWGALKVPKGEQIARSAFYTLNVAISFFLMLVVMTYNGQLILSVLLGGFIGHYIFHSELSFDSSDGKGMACH